MTGQVDVYIHAGAHRTGTSSFQLFLDANAPHLRELGYAAAYPSRDGVPGGKLRLRLPGPRHDAAACQGFAEMNIRHLRHRCAGQGRLILSEENLPGRMLHFFEGRFFPAQDQRLGVMARALPGPVAHLLYVIRPYDELFVSAYRCRARENRVTPFADLVPAMAAFDGGWVRTVAALRQHLAPHRLTVLTYEARGSNPDLLQQLVPDLDLSGFAEAPRTLNVSASDAALQALQARFRDGLAPDAAEIDALVARHADNRHSRGFARFPEAERNRLRARYFADLDRLGQMPGVTLLRHPLDAARRTG